MHRLLFCYIVLALFAVQARAAAPEIVLPQGRSSFYSDEAIEIAVAGLSRGERVTIELTPRDSTLAPITFEAIGDGSTLGFALPPRALAPSAYTLSLQHKKAFDLQLSSGTNISTFLLSQTRNVNELHSIGANFILGNAFNFGLLASDGGPAKSMRARPSAGMEAFDRAIALNLPTLVYMYYSGYITHKPWGTNKSWAEPHLVEAMRLLSYHTAQRLRRFGKNILSIGTLDEPGLSWGETPLGKEVSGIPNWDEHVWYESRGWSFTNDPGRRSEADWMKYMTVRTRILKEANAAARNDMKSVWPAVRFSTDLYAPHAIMDGTDPMNQEINDFPSTHVFLDWGTGKLGLIGALYLEKAHDPLAKIAHATNGQLFGDTVPQPNQRDAYRLMLNAMLAAGVRSNWWLNATGMSPSDLVLVDEPGLRIGPLFANMSPDDHDVAILWSFTELAMREKSIAAEEAQLPPEKNLTRWFKDYPPNSALTSEGVEIPRDAYSVGETYKQSVLGAHQALSRAGYAAHILHEEIVIRGALAHYKTLIVVGQTFELPPPVRAAIETFVSTGGRVVIDKTTTVAIKDALVTDGNFRDLHNRWSALFALDPKKFRSAKEASYFRTNYFMDEAARSAARPLKARMKLLPARPVFESDSIELGGERHVGGEGALYMILNGHEALPPIQDSQKYFLYNYASYSARYRLRGIAPTSVVYRIEGTDWKTVARIANPSAFEQRDFQPGEMKLYLVAPRAPKGIALDAKIDRSHVVITARLRNLKMPWPITVSITKPDGTEATKIYRATDASGSFTESFPLGSNAMPGLYRVSVTSPIENLAANTTVHFARTEVVPTPLDRVRIFDADVIRRFFAGRPSVIIALGNDSQRPTAEKLALALEAAGISATLRSEGVIAEKVRYPRIWNPWVLVCKPNRPEESTAGLKIEAERTVESDEGGSTVVRDRNGRIEKVEWRKPNTLLTIGGAGFLDWSGDSEMAFEPGCKVYVDGGKNLKVLNGAMERTATSDAFRAKWSRPWSSLCTNFGGYQLQPGLPEAYRVDAHLILLGDARGGELVSALQASELLPEVADEKYPGPGKALLSFAWSPFSVGKNVILIGASDEAGLNAGAEQLIELLH